MILSAALAPDAAGHSLTAGPGRVADADRRDFGSIGHVGSDNGAIELFSAGRRLQLLPDKAILLPATRTLLVADVHIGKATSFRQLGVPVPAGTTEATLAALTRLVERHAARRIVFLGDFLHSKRSLAPVTLASVARWRERHAALELTLVRGNHDDRAGDPPAGLGIQPVDEPFDSDGLALGHHPRRRPGRFVLAGHLHPCIGLGGRAHDFHRLACFWFSGAPAAAALGGVGAEDPDRRDLGHEGVGVLPAFGAFTGMHPIRPARGDRIYVVGDGRVHPVPRAER